MASRVLSVRHGDEPLDDRATAWLGQAGYDVQTLRPFRGDLLGEPGEDLAATIIYGGPFNVYETRRYPFLNEEYRWIDTCLSAGIPVLGICQGCQMIAHHLGAWAGPRDIEIFEFGYYPITPTPEAGELLDAPLVVTQAYFHTFDLPQGAVRLAGNSNYENQAFRYGDKTYGFQFHSEVTKTGFRRWQEQKHDAYVRPCVQAKEAQNRLMDLHDGVQEAWFHGFLESFMGDIR